MFFVPIISGITSILPKWQLLFDFIHGATLFEYIVKDF